MGIYLNPKNDRFFRAINSSIYVDKTEMIEKLNAMIGTNEPMVCVCRPRRFGKTMAASMLAAYYGKSYDSKELFTKYKISKTSGFEKHLNKYDVLWIDIQDLIGKAIAEVKYGNETLPLRFAQELVIREFRREYPEMVTGDAHYLPEVIQAVSYETGKKFVIIFDEWDSVFRNYSYDKKLMDDYTELLRGLFKGSTAENCFALVYITGILPPKKYGKESPMNNFKEYTMVESKWMAQYVGFTENEVKELCKIHNMDFEEMQQWYDGYELEGAEGVEHIYNPRSVVESISNRKYSSYWVSTETYESLRDKILMNFDGLKDAVRTLLAGGDVPINVNRFKNDMTSMNSRDDVLSLLVHLGYLGYLERTKSVVIPNEEIRGEFVNAVEDTGWKDLDDAIKNSAKLLEDTISGDADAVAEGISRVHEEATSIQTYNNENDLSCVITLAYYCAKKDYICVREFPSGKGFADMVYIPKKNSDKPALVVELKWDKSAETAIQQIKEKHYTQALEGYTGNILLVGINYDKESKKHGCIIEKYKR